MKRMSLVMAIFLSGALISYADQISIQQGPRQGYRVPQRQLTEYVPRQQPFSVGMSPAMLALATPLQLPSANWDVAGLRINIFYGECVNFYGLDISALVGRSRGEAAGLQIAAIANIVNGNCTALQIGTVNVVEGDFAGMQIGVANYAASLPGSEAQTWQIGVFNGGGTVKGFQFGLINYTEAMVGVQLGLINIIANKDVSFLPIINAAF
ncbi:MAG: hypothetical protein GX230_04675 [Lentisphaerae bacterium]|nr:hypothetical protein [Lentisphaerota bacterium]